jgi:hypothetical protein
MAAGEANPDASDWHTPAGLGSGGADEDVVESGIETSRAAD